MPREKDLKLVSSREAQDARKPSYERAHRLRLWPTSFEVSVDLRQKYKPRP